MFPVYYFMHHVNFLEALTAQYISDHELLEWTNNMSNLPFFNTSQTLIDLLIYPSKVSFVAVIHFSQI